MPSHSMRNHFARSSPSVAATYDALVAEARRFGPVREEPKKTSIHLARRTAFAGVAIQRAALILTLKSARDITSKRVRRREQISAGRWHVEVRLAAPDEVNSQIVGWLRRAYALAT